MNPAKADGSLEPGPKKYAGPQQCPGSIHDKLAVALWAVETVLYGSHTDSAVVGFLLLPDACGVSMHHKQGEDLHYSEQRVKAHLRHTMGIKDGSNGSPKLRVLTAARPASKLGRSALQQMLLEGDSSWTSKQVDMQGALKTVTCDI